MICHRCLLRVARRKAPSVPTTTTRNLTQTGPFHAEAVTSATTTTTNPRPHDLPAATSSPAAAQPFSTPLSPAPREHEDDPDDASRAAAEVKKRQRTPSSVPAGTVLKGLNFMKNKADPVALEDAEYPEWLWEVLRSKEEGAGVGAEGEGDLFSKSKKQRRKAAKALRRQQMMGQDSEVKIPVYEQSVDLAGGIEDIGKAQEAREELTGAMRKERRRKIKEDNFLRAMG